MHEVSIEARMQNMILFDDVLFVVRIVAHYNVCWRHIINIPNEDTNTQK